MMGINIVYYIQVNLICIVILFIFKRQLRRNSEKYSTSNNVFYLLLWISILLCVSDMFAGIFRGQVFDGAKVFIEVSNLVFYECLTVISYLWMIYVFIKLGISEKLKKTLLICSIPLILFSIVAIFNPFNHLLFTIDEKNLFARNWGTYLHWLITWSYFIVTTIKVMSAIIMEKNKNKRKELIPFLYFIIAPAIASVTQMLFYGITSSQVGITISIIIISLAEQNNRVFSDSLTGLNNRHSFNEYIISYMQHHPNSELTLLMIDINNFKQVNDKYGHISGDRALKNVAAALKNISSNTPNRLFMCRYGGDEFLVATFDCGQEEINFIRKQIHEEIKSKNAESNEPYDLTVSIGLANGKLADYDDIEYLLHVADEAMYDEKKLSKNKEQNSVIT